MSSKLVSSIALAACLLASGGAFAEVLYQQAPTADATGESANNPVVTGEPLLFQSIPSLGNVTLEKIVWWGYRNPAYDPNPYPGTVESFEVYLDGSVMAGNLTLDFGSNLPNTSRPLVRYTLDVADAPLTATEIALANMNDDVSWFWQGAGLDAAGVAGVDLLLKCGGDQNVAVDVPELVVGHHFGFGEAADAAVFFNVLEERWHIEPGFAVNGAAVVLYRNDACAGFGKQLAGHTAHIAEALHRNAGAGDFQPDVVGGLHTDGEHTAPRGVFTT